MTDELYLEDLTPGRVFQSAGETLVTADGIKRFAREFDPQPFHTDEEAAKDTFFEGLAASGWHTVGMTMPLLLGCLPVAGGLIGAGVEEIRWPRPVRPGDVLRVGAEVLESRPSRSRPDRGLVKLRTTTYDGDGEAVQIMVTTLVVPQRPKAGETAE